MELEEVVSLDEAPLQAGDSEQIPGQTACRCHARLAGGGGQVARDEEVQQKVEKNGPCQCQAKSSDLLSSSLHLPLRC